MSNVENVSPQVLRGVAREVRRLAARPPAGVKLLLRDANLTDLVALIEGPADTPYAGGVFRVRLALGREFPATAPRAYFLTKIFHPNVSRSGEVCVNTLQRDWRPELGLEHALLAVKCLLIAPNPESALNAEAAALLRDRYDDYFARAKLFTEIHARAAPAHQRDEVAGVGDDGGEMEAATDVVAGVTGDMADGAASDAAGSAASGVADSAANGAMGGAADGTKGSTSGPFAKRERRPPPHKPPSVKDKRRILKRL